MLPLLSYMFFIMSAIFGLLSVLGINGCNITAYAGPLCYCLGKMFMYFVFIYRLYIVYANSIFAYSNTRLFILFVIAFIFTISIIIANLITLQFLIYYDENNNRGCTVEQSSIVSGIYILFDMSFCIYCCYLFIRPLLILNKKTGNNMQPKDNEMYQIMFKYKILTILITAVLTTMIFIGIIILSKFTTIV
eukprot:480368_1